MLFELRLWSRMEFNKQEINTKMWYNCVKTKFNDDWPSILKQNNWTVGPIFNTVYVRNFIIIIILFFF